MCWGVCVLLEEEYLFKLNILLYDVNATLQHIPASEITTEIVIRHNSTRQFWDSASITRLLSVELKENCPKYTFRCSDFISVDFINININCEKKTCNTFYDIFGLWVKTYLMLQNFNLKWPFSKNKLFSLRYLAACSHTRREKTPLTLQHHFFKWPYSAVV